MKYPAYPEYRDSGVSWLGQVPARWKIKRGRFVMHVNPPAPLLRSLKDGTEVSFVPMDAVREYGGLRLDETRVNTEIGAGYTEFQEGDVIVAKITPCFENGKGSLATGLVSSAGYGTTELHVLRPNQLLDRSFLFYLTITHGYRNFGESEMYGAGGQKRVPPEYCKNFSVPLPPYSEQVGIVRFLDHETGRIDTLVEKKRRLIALLKEERTTLITRIVTRGLPADAAHEFGLEPHTSFKDTGIEWLGEIPEKWAVIPLFRIATTIQTGPFGSQLHSSDYVEGGIPLINPAHIRANKVIPDELSSIDKATAIRLSRHQFQDGDIVMGRRGEIGRCAVIGAREAGWLCGTGSLVIRLRNVNAAYFATIISGIGFRSLLELHAVGTTMLNLNPMIVGRMLVPVPPVDEQVAIASYINRETSKIERLVEKVEAAIERLQELRTALITAAVTGKIDVRSTLPQKDVA